MQQLNTPRANRLHIGIFGKCNAGKSSVINSITSQKLAVVSDTKGTTTDPVLKSMELLPIGPVVLIDTGGIDDESELGALRVEKSEQMLGKTDVALYVVDSTAGIDEVDFDFINKIKSKNIPVIIVFNKSDLVEKPEKFDDMTSINVSSKTGAGIEQLKELIGKIALEKPNYNPPILADLITKDDLILLITPIDESAPKGRLILPQQQTIREILDVGATVLIMQEHEIASRLGLLSVPPSLVVTDSKVFSTVNKQLPNDVPLTSFSILFARHKGILRDTVLGVSALETLKDGDKVLISEGCTHHRQCDDIGRALIPKLISTFTKKQLQFEFSSGGEFPRDVSHLSLIVHCGGCMLNSAEIINRLNIAKSARVPMTNYGILIAYTQGILQRSIEIFDDVKNLI